MTDEQKIERQARIIEDYKAWRQNASVDHPAHYTRGGIEAIDAIEAWGLGFNLGNVIKYVARAGHKGETLEDLRKARWYIDREIDCEIARQEAVVKP